MQGEYVVNVSKLREQSDRFTSEKIIANRLSSSLKTVQRNADPEKQSVYRKLIRQVDDLALFYSDMSKAAATTANDVADVLSKIATDLEDNAIHNIQKFNLND